MAQNNRPPRKRDPGAKRSSVPKVDDLVSRMRELRRLRQEVVKAETGQSPEVDATASPTVRSSRPK
jgi:hypothetical protein